MKPSKTLEAARVTRWSRRKLPVTALEGFFAVKDH